MAMPDLPATSVVDTLAEIWGVPRQPAGCSLCKQVHLVEASRLGRICPHCARGMLESQPAVLRQEPPEHLIPFSQSREELYTILKNYTNGVWIRPDDFNPEDLLKHLMPVFWPEWLADSAIVGYWSAEMGYDYQVKSSEELYRAGQWQTREVVETRVRWEARAGQIARSYDNIRVPGMEEHHRLSQLIGGFHTDRIMPYQPVKIGQASLRVPDLSPESAWPLAQANLDRAAGIDCTQAAGAQHVRNFNLRARYESINWTQLLLPVYVTYYTDDQGQAHSVYINGQTGVAGGVRLASQRKGWIWAGVSLAIAIVFFVLGLISFLAVPLFAPLGVLGGLLVLLGLGMGVFAIVPAVWPWRWNRDQITSKVIRSKSPSRNN
jgi:hypothetical protein